MASGHARTPRRPVAAGLHRLPDLLALRTHRELLRRAARHPDLAAQRDDGRAHHHGLGELVLVDVVAEALVVTLVGGDRALPTRSSTAVSVGGETEVGNHRTSERQLSSGSTGRLTCQASSPG